MAVVAYLMLVIFHLSFVSFFVLRHLSEHPETSLLEYLKNRLICVFTIVSALFFFLGVSWGLGQLGGVIRVILLWLRQNQVCRDIATILLHVGPRAMLHSSGLFYEFHSLGFLILCFVSFIALVGGIDDVKLMMKPVAMNCGIVCGEALLVYGMLEEAIFVFIPCVLAYVLARMETNSLIHQIWKKQRPNVDDQPRVGEHMA